MWVISELRGGKLPGRSACFQCEVLDNQPGRKCEASEARTTRWPNYARKHLADSVMMFALPTTGCVIACTIAKTYHTT